MQGLTIVHVHDNESFLKQCEPCIGVLDCNFSPASVANHLAPVRFIANHGIRTVPAPVLVLSSCRTVVVHEVTRLVERGAVQRRAGLDRSVNLGHCRRLRDRFQPSFPDPPFAFTIGVFPLRVKVRVLQVWEASRLSAHERIVWRDAIVERERVRDEQCLGKKPLECDLCTISLHVLLDKVHDVPEHGVTALNVSSMLAWRSHPEGGA